MKKDPPQILRVQSILQPRRRVILLHCRYAELETVWLRDSTSVVSDYSPAKHQTAGQEMQDTWLSLTPPEIPAISPLTLFRGVDVPLMADPLGATMRTRYKYGTVKGWPVSLATPCP